MVDSGGGGLLNCVKIIPELLSRQLEDLREYLKLPGWMVGFLVSIEITTGYQQQRKCINVLMLEFRYSVCKIANKCEQIRLHDSLRKICA